MSIEPISTLGIIFSTPRFAIVLQWTLLTKKFISKSQLECTVATTTIMKPCSSNSSSVDRWTQVVDLYVQSVVYHSEYRTIRIQIDYFNQSDYFN